MKENYCKTKISTIALILVLTLAATLVALPVVSAHDPPKDQTTYAYIVVTPNPIGVNQPAFVLMWINRIPPSAAGIGGERWEGYTLDVTKPDGSTENLGTFTSDPTSSAYILFTPTQVGKYTFEFEFPGQVADLYGPTGIPGSPSVYDNDYFLPSSASTTLTVQEDPVEKIPEYPLPTEYWTRPIEGQNTAWVSVASNWLGWGSGQIVGGGNWGGGGVQPDGIAPNSPHIMWTKPLQDGGVVGGEYSIPSVAYYTGLSYEGKFNNPLIMYGRLYYDTPLSDSATGGPYTCVDLATGETLWERDDISPSFGQLYDYESFNQHGVIGDGYLWETSGRTIQTWRAIDPRTGKDLFNLTNVPVGVNVYGSDGEILRYVLNYTERKLYLWTSAALPNSPLVATPGTTSNAYQYRPIGKEADMSNNYLWNVTIPDLPGDGNPYILSVIPDDLVLGTSTSWPMFLDYGTPDSYTFWAISLKPETRGKLLWIQDYDAPLGNQTLVFMGTPNVNNRNNQVDSVNRVFFLTVKETMQWYGYDLDTGDILWGPVGDFNTFQYYGTTSNPPAPGYVYDGKFYVAGYGGELQCFDSRTGNLNWIYNNTNSGLETPWGQYPLFVSTFADGKIYLFTSEHSPNVPLYKGSKIRCVNAANGEELWTLLGWFACGSFGQVGSPVADGHYVYFNLYDSQIYSIGKGPSSTTVSVQDNVIQKGESTLITGTVTDESAGTKQDEQIARFPHGVPAVSDESMSEWMEYVYMQKSCPENVVGVQVKLTALDANGNSVNIGTVTADGTGMFKKMWTPENEGEYTIIATFESSESYWYSYAETAIGVGPAAEEDGTDLTSLEDSVGDLEEGLSNQTTYILVILALVIIALIIAIISLLRSRK